mmetsp:Transcript_31209/g.27461  ORF Transcript_31209/g.27461 Transcript_31209/m.27461 type:complete len:412 (-) Transcript_31209:538-1773(-)
MDSILQTQINTTDAAEESWSFGVDWEPIITDNNIKPRFKNVKEEVLKNSFYKISKQKWNNLLKKSHAILNCKIGCHKRIKFGKMLKQNNIKLKHILSIKLYTDDDNLQREFSKCFIKKYQNDSDYKDRISSFYHWRKELKFAFNALSKIRYCSNNQKQDTLFHGVTFNTINIKSHNETYYGPLSTTSDINVARDFAGKDGMILCIKPLCNDSKFKTMNISLISEFEQESEYLLFNHNIKIENIIYSKDFDNNYIHYKQVYVTKCIKMEEKISYSPSSSIVESLKTNSSKLDFNNKQVENRNFICIKGNSLEMHEEKKQNSLALTINEDNVNLLAAIYDCALDFCCNLTKYQQNKTYYSSEHQQCEINKMLAQFTSICIPKSTMNQFTFKYQNNIDEKQICDVLSKYITVAS